MESIKTFSLLLLFIGLLLLASCQSAQGSTPPPGGEPSLTFTPSTEAGQELSAKQAIESTPVPADPQPTPARTRPALMAARPTPTPRPPTPDPGRARGGEVVVGALGHPDTLNPLLAESDAGRALVPLLFDSLLAFDPMSGQLTPRLAEEWRVSSDSRTITFTLHSGARWHDGQPLTADDVVFSIQAARDPAQDSLYGPTLNHVLAVDAPDNKTVIVRLDVAHCPSLAALGELPIVPQHLLENSEVNPTAFGDAPVGSGPFAFEGWTPAGELRLTRHDGYWGGAPFLDAWSYRAYDSLPELQQALENGEIDAAMLPPGHLPATADLEAAYSAYYYPAPEYEFVAFNNDHPVLRDARVRRALSLAIDREQLVQQVLHGNGELMAASLPALHWTADTALQPPPYNPDEARQLLAEAGWSDSDGDGWLDRDGERLRMPVRTNGGNRLREGLASLVASYYRAIGVDASVELVAWGALVDDIFTHDFGMLVFGWPLRAEPDQSRWWLSTQDEIGSGDNFVSFSDRRVDRLLQEAATASACESGERAEAYRQIQHALAEERPYDFLLIPYATVLTRPELRGLVAGPFAGPLTSAAKWHIAP